MATMMTTRPGAAQAGDLIFFAGIVAGALGNGRGIGPRVSKAAQLSPRVVKPTAALGDLLLTLGKSQTAQLIVPIVVPAAAALHELLRGLGRHALQLLSGVVEPPATGGNGLRIGRDLQASKRIAAT